MTSIAAILVRTDKISAVKEVTLNSEGFGSSGTKIVSPARTIVPIP